jgi:hypothetical protein
MRSYLVSQLARVWKDAAPAAFLQQYPHPWVVWEPGRWQPPERSGATLVVPPPAAGTLPGHAGDALALALRGKPASPPQVTLGRGAECDLKLDDATLSSVHLLFMLGPDGAWTVRDGGSRNGTWVDDVRLAAGQPCALTSGTRLRVGQVSLTYYTPEGLLARVRQNPTSAPR